MFLKIQQPIQLQLRNGRKGQGTTSPPNKTKILRLNRGSNTEKQLSAVQIDRVKRLWGFALPYTHNNTWKREDQTQSHSFEIYA